MKAITCFVFAIVALGWVGAARAEAASLTRWSMAAQGCVVEPGSASRLAQDATGAVRFAGNATGTGYLVCPVAVFAPTSPCMGLGITVRVVKTIPNSVAHVRTFLAALPIGQGSVATPSGLTSTLGEKHEDVTNVIHTFDFDANYYYVVMEMRRDSPTSTVAFFGTRLTDCLIT